MRRQNNEEYELELREPWASCERQLCACSKPDAPRFRYQCEEGRGCSGNFERMDYGCYRLFVGKAPMKITDEEEFECMCNSTTTKNDKAWNQKWLENVEKLKQKWRNN